MIKQNVVAYKFPDIISQKIITVIDNEPIEIEVFNPVEFLLFCGHKVKSCSHPNETKQLLCPKCK